MECTTTIDTHKYQLNNKILPLFSKFNECHNGVAMTCMYQEEDMCVDPSNYHVFRFCTQWKSDEFMNIFADSKWIKTHTHIYK